MELDWLRTFLAVADTGGFTAAAGQVRRSQPRVSAHVAALEQELGTTLVDRAQRPVALTSAGLLTADFARDILDLVGTARSTVRALRAAEGGAISVLTTACIGGSFLPGVLGSLRARQPAARVGLIEADPGAIEAGLATATTLLAVVPVRSGATASQLRVRRLWREGMKLVLPSGHPLAARSGSVPLAALRGTAPVELCASGHDVDEITRVLGGADVPARVVLAADTPQTVVAAVRSGLGIGVLNSVGLSECSTRGTVVLDLDRPAIRREVALYWQETVLATQLGRDLHTAVLSAPLPAGAEPPGGGHPAGADDGADE
jgi:DNA-binding transcriptional LysR family regulator